MKTLALSLATCSTLLLSATAAQAVQISGTFDYSTFNVVTTFPPDFGATIPSRTVNFTFDTSTSTGTVVGFPPLQGFPPLVGTIKTGAGGSTFSATPLFDDFVASFDLNGDGKIVLDFTTNFAGLTSGGPVPFTLSTEGQNQFVNGSGTITSFSQSVPFEFSPAIGLVAVGGLFATKKLIKKAARKELQG